MHTPPEQVVKHEFDRVRGRLCGQIESMGLSDQQTRGAIATIKSLTYDSQKAILEAVAARQSA
jgi:hypothetical protein